MDLLKLLDVFKNSERFVFVCFLSVFIYIDVLGWFSGNCCVYNQYTCICLWKKWNGGDFNGCTLWLYLVASFCDDIRDKVCFLSLGYPFGFRCIFKFLYLISISFTIGLVLMSWYWIKRWGIWWTFYKNLGRKCVPFTRNNWKPQPIWTRCNFHALTFRQRQNLFEFIVWLVDIFSLVAAVHLLYYNILPYGGI